MFDDSYLKFIAHDGLGLDGSFAELKQEMLVAVF